MMQYQYWYSENGLNVGMFYSEYKDYFIFRNKMQSKLLTCFLLPFCYAVQES